MSVGYGTITSTSTDISDWKEARCSPVLSAAEPDLKARKTDKDTWTADADQQLESMPTSTPTPSKPTLSRAPRTRRNKLGVGVKRVSLPSRALTAGAGTSTADTSGVSPSCLRPDTQASLLPAPADHKHYHYLSSGHLDLTQSDSTRDAQIHTPHAPTTLQINNDVADSGSNPPIDILITDHDYTHPTPHQRSSTLSHPASAVLPPQCSTALYIPIIGPNRHRRQFVHYLPYGSAAVDEATTSVAVRRGRYEARARDERGCKVESMSRRVGPKWMRYDPKQLTAEMQGDERLWGKGKGKAERENVVELERQLSNGCNAGCGRSTIGGGTDEAMPVQTMPVYYLRCQTYHNSISRSGLSLGSEDHGQLIRSGAACTCKARALAIQPCLEEEGESPDEAVLNGVWVKRTRTLKASRMRCGKEKGKGKERAHLTWGKCVTAEKRARARELAGRYTSRESAKRLAEAAAARAEIEARTKKLMAERLERIKAREEKIKKATERLMALENAELMLDRQDEDYDSESSESVYDESSDDENLLSIVEDILLAGVERSIPLVRQNSNAATSERGVVVTMPKPKPKPKPKENWKNWFRQMFCVPNANTRKPRKLQRRGNH
ncbi:hypothetical protein LTR70_004356 [Exophiala xenobiotica]|uniref:Uncharacterized protein n=1 Tax=Lithohypha guttulata TaxID=1690604 RepID=A0ABR0KJ93_9EURO|nr:hypothetical protein LTR24_001933 [Lithohypha guttulata]KAK5320947.1 hypothetical protein LTR70_004356 [Exophiala xenobiotica]